MIDLSNFKLWLTDNKTFSPKTISNIVSRFKRADSMSPWFNDAVYQFRLEQLDVYQSLSGDVRSQIKRAVSLYFEYILAQEAQEYNGKNSDMNSLSLFANIGVAEAYLKGIGINVAVANELIERRALLYSKIYPETHMICGDITDKEIFCKVIKESKDRNVEIIIATPPCQGMSTVGQKLADDERNSLVCYVIEAVKEIQPKYVLIENVPMFLNTEIVVNGKKVLIPALLKEELGKDYIINNSVIDTKDYSVPQTRERAIVLMTRIDQNVEWTVPEKDKKVITMRDAIGNLPKLDPFISDVDEKELLEIFPQYFNRKKEALHISKWHNPPHHVKRQVIVMQHTLSGQTAFDNPIHYPVKANGDAVRGFRNTYKRQNWDSAAYTVTMDNRKISSQNNVHPGRVEYVDEHGDDIYSDARALTLYELMKIMSIPDDWPVPENTSEAFLRRIIGEGIPPLFVEKLFKNLLGDLNKWKY